MPQFPAGAEVSSRERVTQSMGSQCAAAQDVSSGSSSSVVRCAGAIGLPSLWRDVVDVDAFPQELIEPADRGTWRQWVLSDLTAFTDSA